MIPVIPVKSLIKITGIDDDDHKSVLNKMILDDISALAKTGKYIILVGKHNANKRRLWTLKKM